MKNLRCAMGLGLLVLAIAASAESPYAGEESRAIKSLSASEIQALRQGHGMGYAKAAELNVSDEVVETFGAVSVATAWAMAQGALDASQADVAVAITGIAGPDGGTPTKPVGTVVFARAERQPGDDEVTADQKLFVNENRAGVRLQAALCALDLLMP